MAMNLKLQMRLSQQLIMTPQLQQAIKLLQLSRTELEELIDQSLIENPVLEESPEVASDEMEIPLEVAERTPERKEELETDWQQYIESHGGVMPERHGRDDGEEANLEATLAHADSLQEHLLWQLEMAKLSQVELLLGEQIIGNLDEDGYLTVSLNELLQLNPELHGQTLAALQKGPLTLPLPKVADPSLYGQKHVPPEKVKTAPKPRGRQKAQPPVFDDGMAEEQAAPALIEVDERVAQVAEGVLRFLQTFDPTGCGARSLGECLEIQVVAMGLKESLAHQIVQKDLKLLENKDLRRVARRHKVELEEVLEAYKLIMGLEPKPGRPYGNERTQHIVPDVYIYKFSANENEHENQVGQYRVQLNDTGLPRLRINRFYREMAEGADDGNGLTREYIQEKIKSGNWLMKSIEQRQKTILKVTKSILRHQYDFFEKGIHSLKPLVLKDVAEDIGVHESTVSRITTNKYVHTPQGIFELKYFFASGIDQGQGEVISSKKIKDMIQTLIEGEDNRNPLTDIQIAERLSEESKIKVARRTVAKYREALNLLPSNRRKQMF